MSKISSSPAPAKKAVVPSVWIALTLIATEGEDCIDRLSWSETSS